MRMPASVAAVALIVLGWAAAMPAQTLKSGPTYMAFGEAIVPAKELSVQMQNYDYNRNN